MYFVFEHKCSVLSRNTHVLYQDVTHVLYQKETPTLITIPEEVGLMQPGQIRSATLYKSAGETFQVFSRQSEINQFYLMILDILINLRIL